MTNYKQVYHAPITPLSIRSVDEAIVWANDLIARHVSNVRPVHGLS